MNEIEWQLSEDKRPLELVNVAGVDLKRGDRVLLKPRRKGGDIFDMVLKGKTATIETIEQDYENKIHIAVVLEDDPGKELGMIRKTGHRFFFAPEEIEPV
jgi:hypothetical protein